MRKILSYSQGKAAYNIVPQEKLFEYKSNYNTDFLMVTS